MLFPSSTPQPRYRDSCRNQQSTTLSSWLDNNMHPIPTLLWICPLQPRGLGRDFGWPQVPSQVHPHILLWTCSLQGTLGQSPSKAVGITSLTMCMQPRQGTALLLPQGKEKITTHTTLWSQQWAGNSYLDGLQALTTNRSFLGQHKETAQ